MSPFATGEEPEPSDAEKQEAVTEHLGKLSTHEAAEAYLDVMSQGSTPRRS